MMAEPTELDRATAERMIDEERGTLFNWLELPNFLELKKGEVNEYPDRVWINEITEALKTDGQVAGVEQALTMPLRQANITLERPDRDRGGKITEYIEDVLMRPAAEGGMLTPFDLVVGQMTFACAVARTFHEMVWTRREDGRLGFAKIAWRPPGSCEIVRDRDTGDLKGYKQFIDWDFQAKRRQDVDWRGYVPIPPERAVIHINNQHRDPVYGWSDLAVCNWAFQLKRKVLLLWATLLTRVAEPWVLAYGGNAPEAKQNAKQIAALRSGGVAAVTRTGDNTDKMFDVLDTVGQGAALYQDFLKYLDGMMSQSVLAGWMDLAGAASQSGTGSYALSADQSGLFLASRHGAARELSATINYQIIRPLVRVNFGPKAPVPRIKFEKIGSEQVNKAMELLSTFGSSQNLQVPSGFLDMLIERVAAYLDLPDDRVRAMIEQNAKVARAAAMQNGVPVAAPGTDAGNLEDAVTGALAAVTASGSPGPQEGAA
jgi:Protein of unknown function (DUF935)